jgi:hypothetical protein
MTPLAELIPSVRRAKIADALEAALRQIKEATPTSDIVKRVSVILGAEKETGVIARVIGELAPSHPRAQETGETFVKYGRTMRRREWLAPPKRKPGSAQISLDDAELRRRREAIAAHEAEDEWTVQPPAFLED